MDSSSLFADDIKAELMKQILSDPGVPVPCPSIPAWQIPPHPVAEVQSSQLPHVTDFAIIGSGVTGCAVAKTLLDEPHAGQGTVTMFEARTLASGATSRNAGFLKSHLGTTFAHHIKSYGEEEARIFVRFADRTAQKMRGLVADRALHGDLASELRDVQCISAYRDRTGLQTAVASVKLYEKAFPETKGSISVVNAETLRDTYHLKDFIGGIASPSAVFWPYRLITNVLASILDAHTGRFTIETNTPVTSVTHSAETDTEYPYILQSPRGEVRAKHVFHCSNAFVGHLVPKLRGLVHPTRHSNSCQSAGTLVPDWGSKYCWLFPQDPRYDPHTGIFAGTLHYMQQNAVTGDLFFGGQRDYLQDFLSSDDSKVSSTSATNLSTKLSEIFDGTSADGRAAAVEPEVQSIWSGIIGSTPDHNPIVGKLPISIAQRGGSHGGEWIAAGYNGYGMVQCWSCGEAIAQMALGRSVPDWLPKALLCSEQRLFDESRMGPEQALVSLVSAQPLAVGATAGPVIENMPRL